MKKILITGASSYIGKSLKRWLENHHNKYSVDTISLRSGSWREEEFSTYDVIFHAAGIAHVSTDPKMKESYYKVNRDLTIEIAKKAKEEGVSQFIFMSSIIVYGDSTVNERVINEDTIPSPSNFYGDSKLQAEQGILSKVSQGYKVAIIRPPMIYGENSKGNYPKLAKVARTLPIFPNIENSRSMLHIDNLCEFIRLIIDNQESGIFFPQNKEYVNTSEMVQRIAEFHGKNIILTKMFNPMLIRLIPKSKVINKLFGNLVYDQTISHYKENYQIRNFKESIEMTEK